MKSKKKMKTKHKKNMKTKYKKKIITKYKNKMKRKYTKEIPVQCVIKAHRLLIDGQQRLERHVELILGHGVGMVVQQTAQVLPFSIRTTAGA